MMSGSETPPNGSVTRLAAANMSMKSAKAAALNATRTGIEPLSATDSVIIAIAPTMRIRVLAASHKTNSDDGPNITSSPQAFQRLYDTLEHLNCVYCIDAIATKYVPQVK